MNTTPSQHQDPLYPTLHPAWHKMIRRSRSGDRTLALILCRRAYDAKNGGCFTGVGSLGDNALATAFGISLRQAQRLRSNTSLWRWAGDDLQLFFFGAEPLAGAPSPATYGKRRARHASLAIARKARAARRQQLSDARASEPYADIEESTLQAAEEEPDTPLDDEL